MPRNTKRKLVDPAGPDDALAMLTADHKKVQALFAQVERMQDKDEETAKGEIVRQICNELTIHTRIEEEIFYPAVRKAIDDDDLMDEADVEHAGAKDLVEQLKNMQPADDHYDAKVTVLGEQVEHHIKEEQNEMFPKVRKSDLDTVALGAEMADLKLELMEELSLYPDFSKPARSSRMADKHSRRELH